MQPQLHEDKMGKRTALANEIVHIPGTLSEETIVKENIDQKNKALESYPVTKNQAFLYTFPNQGKL